MTLWTPNQPKTEVNAWIDLHDGDILAMERGPLAWHKQQEGKTVDVDRYTKDLKEQFAEIGLLVDVQVWDTAQRGTYAFKVEIQKRLTPFDPDRQVHEVVNNILDIPGDEKGFVIDTKKAMQEMEKKKREDGGKHRHGH